MKTYKIAIIAGDGIGPEVINEGLKVLAKVSKKYKFKIETTHFDYGGGRYLKTSETLSDAEIQNLRNFDAILLGGIGHPDVKPGILERGILLKLRFDLDLYVNLRPVRLYENVKTPLKGKRPKDIDYIVFRENTGDLYTGVGEFQNKGTDKEIAIQQMIYSKHQVERCLRYAFEYLRNRHKNNPWRGLTKDQLKQGYVGKLTLCGKTNVLTYVYDLWERTFHEVGKNYPEILRDYVHVDAICIYMIESPERFDGIVTGNMFGDIITDLAAVTQGGMGIAPSGNINPNGVSMFEPIHGTAPSFTGKGVVNPIATVLAVQMMLEHFKEEKAAKNIESAVKKTIKKMRSMLVEKMGYSTSQVGNLITQNI